MKPELDPRETLHGDQRRTGVLFKVDSARKSEDSQLPVQPLTVTVKPIKIETEIKEIGSVKATKTSPNRKVVVATVLTVGGILAAAAIKGQSDENTSLRTTLDALRGTDKAVTLTPTYQKSTLSAAIAAAALAATPTPTPSSTSTTSTETPIPTPTPTKTPAATLTSTETLIPTPEVKVDHKKVYPGELPFNNILEISKDETALEFVIEILLKDLELIKKDPKKSDDVKRANAFLSSLINPFGRGVSDDPAKEPGLGQTELDIKNFRTIGDIIKNADKIAVDGIAHKNGNDLITLGIFGPANDRDAILAVLAVVAANNENPEAFKGITTLSEALKDKNLIPVISRWEDKFLEEIQERSLGVSDEETERRNKKDQNDMSVLIESSLRRDSQWESCDVYLRKAGKRTGQRQTTRLVTHKGDEKDTFITGNAEEEFVLFVFSARPGAQFGNSNNWDMDGFTARAHPDDESGRIIQKGENSSTMEELRPCGVVGPVVIPSKPGQPQRKTTSPENTPFVTPQWTPKPRNTEVPVPTNPHILPTPTLGQSFPTPPRTTSTPIPIAGVLGMGGAIVEKKLKRRNLSRR